MSDIEPIEFSTLDPTDTIEDGDELLVVRAGLPMRFDGDLATGGGGTAEPPVAVDFVLPPGQLVYPAEGDFSTVVRRDGATGFTYGDTLLVVAGGVVLTRGLDYEAPGGVAPITFLDEEGLGTGDDGLGARVTLLSYAVDAPYLNTGRGAINPKDHGCKGNASHETGLSPEGDDDTAAMQAVFDLARQSGLVVEASTRDCFGIGVVRADCDIGVLKIGRSVGLMDRHGIWFPGLSGCLLDGSDAFDVNPTGRRIQSLEINAAYGWSKGLWINGGEDFAINELLVRRNNVNGNYADTGIRGGGGFGLGWQTHVASERNAAGLRVDLYRFRIEQEVTSNETTGAASAFSCSGVPPLLMSTMGANAYHKAYGGTYEECEFYAEDWDIYAEVDGGYYGAGVNGANRNGRVRGRFENNVRGCSLQNNNQDITLDVEVENHSSVCVLLDYFNRRVNIRLRGGKSDRLNGAAPIQVIHSAQDVRVADGHFGALPNAVTGASPKAAIMATSDVERLSIVNNRLSGAWSIAAVLVQSGATSLNPATSGVPINFGTGEYTLDGGGNPIYGTGPYEDQAHVDSSVTEISSNIFDSQVDFGSPLIALYQIGPRKLTVGKIAGNEIVSPKFGRVITTYKGTLDPIAIKSITGNDWMKGIGEAQFNLADAKVEEMKNNEGDPGAGGLPGVSVGSGRSPFPAGQQALFLDGTPAGPAWSDGRTWRVGSTAVTAVSSFTSGTLTNVTRGSANTINLVDKSAGAAGYTAGISATNAVTTGADPETEIVVRSGADAGMAINDASTAALLSATKHAVLIGPTGAMGRFVNGGPFGGIEFTANKGDRVSMRYLRSPNRVRVARNDLFVHESPAAINLPNASAYFSYPIGAVGVDVVYAGNGRAEIPGMIKYTTYPSITISGGNVVVSLGVWENVNAFEVVVLLGGNDIEASRRFLAPGETYPPFPTQGPGGYSARVIARSPFGGGAEFNATTAPVTI